MSAFKLLVEGGKDVMLFEITLTKIKHKKIKQTDGRTDKETTARLRSLIPDDDVPQALICFLTVEQMFDFF